MAVILELILEFVLSPLRSKHLWWVVAIAMLVALIALLLYARAPVTIAAD